MSSQIRCLLRRHVPLGYRTWMIPCCLPWRCVYPPRRFPHRPRLSIAKGQKYLADPQTPNKRTNGGRANPVSTTHFLCSTSNPVAREHYKRCDILSHLTLQLKDPRSMVMNGRAHVKQSVAIFVLDFLHLAGVPLACFNRGCADFDRRVHP